MPYDIRQISKNKFEVVSRGSGKVKGTFKTREAARQQQKAIYASEAID
ncbi:MAG: hypothetical protein WC554_04800 [Clostridia bacterium]